MMTKLKCLYGKSLKQFFIISLISCFILLGSSFVNGEWIYRDINEEFMSPGSSTYSQKILSSSAGILEGAGTTKALIYGKYNNNNSSNRLATFWWGIDNKLYGYVPKAGSNVRFSYRKYTNLGVFAGTGFEVLTANQMSNGIPSDNTFSVDTYYSNSNFVNKVSRFAYYMDSSTSLRYSFCWVFDSLNTSICIFNIDGFYDELGTSATASNDYNPPISGLSHIPADFDNSLIGTSPRTSNNSDGGDGNLEGDSGIIYYSDNNQIYYDTFKAIGFDENLCYSNFELTDIVNITTAYYDLFPSPSSGSGANIFELYENWGFYPRNPFNSYYSWYSSRYNKLNNSSDKGTNFIMSLYSGVSIGNYYIFDKLFNNQFIDSYELSYKDYHCFCDMAVNGYDPDDMNHCDLSISFDNIMTNPGIRNGTSIGTDGQFILSGANEFGYFSGSAGIFDVFNRLYSQFKNAFRVDNSLSGTTGILPIYIIFGFFLFVILYILKR